MIFSRRVIVVFLVHEAPGSIGNGCASCRPALLFPSVSPIGLPPSFLKSSPCTVLLLCPCTAGHFRSRCVFKERVCLKHDPQSLHRRSVLVGRQLVLRWRDNAACLGVTYEQRSHRYTSCSLGTTSILTRPSRIRASAWSLSCLLKTWSGVSGPAGSLAISSPLSSSWSLSGGWSGTGLDLGTSGVGTRLGISFS